MYDKAIILEIKEEYALAMKEGGEIVRIKKKEGLAVGQTIYILPEDIYHEKKDSKTVLFPAFTKEKDKSKKKRNHPERFNHFAGIAAAFLVCLSLFLVPQLDTTVHAVVSLDAQNDVQLHLDKDGYVMKAVSVDESVSKDLLDSLKGKKLSEISDQLLPLLGDGVCLIAYAPNEESDSLTFEDEISDLFPQRKTVLLSGTPQDIPAAQQESVSLGRYIAEREALENELYDEDELDDMTLEELLAILAKNSSLADDPEFQEALEDKAEDLIDDIDDDDDDKTESDDDDDKTEADDAEDDKDDDAKDLEEEKQETLKKHKAKTQDTAESSDDDPDHDDEDDDLDDDTDDDADDDSDNAPDND